VAVTIHEVASEAGVSVSTASRILNGGTKGVRRDAVERARRVEAAAKRLGYQPDPSARGLVMKRTFSLGFIGTELGNPVRGKLIEAFRILALRNGYQLLVSGVAYGQDLAHTVESMVARRVDGLILGNLQGSGCECLQALRQTSFPLVEFGQDRGFDWDLVRIDYAGMVRRLTLHLLEEHGLKRVVFAGFGSGCPRHEAYRTAMEEAGQSEHLGFWQVEASTLEAGCQLAQRHVREGARPEAIVCHNDLLAIGVIAGLRICGVRVPEDTAVVGLDNIEFAKYMQPRLTTAGVDSDHLAAALFELLLDRLQGKGSEKPGKIECPAAFHYRESCGCGHCC
jgi:LacI family transcriptional regulator